MLQQLFQENVQPVLAYGTDYRIFWMNQAACRKFPKVLEEMDIRQAFPDFDLSCLQNLPEQFPPVMLSGSSGSGRLTILCLGEEKPFYTAVWSDTVAYSLRQDDAASAEGVELMDSMMRRGVFHIFNHLEYLSQLMEKNGITAGTDSLERIEKSCQQLLRLGINLRGYYGNFQQQTGIVEPVYMEGFLLELFRQVDFKMEASGIFLLREQKSECSACMIEKNRFAAAILNLIDLSAAYLPEGGEMKFSLGKTSGCFSIAFTDTTMPAGVLSGGLDCMETGKEEGRSSMTMPKVSLGFLDRVIRECGGRCLIQEKNPGILIEMRIPLCEEEPPLLVRDISAYTARFRGLNRSSLVSVLLSDLE